MTVSVVATMAQRRFSVSKIEIPRNRDGIAYIGLSGKSCSAASRRSSSAKWYSLRAIKVSALPSSARGNERP